MKPPRFPDGSEDVQRMLAASKTLANMLGRSGAFHGLPLPQRWIQHREGIAGHSHSRGRAKSERLQRIPARTKA